ncbi:MAG TPA: 16S rRNA (cytosine(1402)-N(4))-methyltransferase RsmH [Rhodothermales bacterium]|nr:16S rRNA (cytosine(1402)-N(4))-methyltransferase RsmH [Rhodothermales bacterium]
MNRDDPARADSGDPRRYATEFHAPVLYKAVIEGLVTDRSGVYVDGTLGGGGHMAALLEALDADALVVGIDQDADALAEAQVRLAKALGEGRVLLLHGNFGDAERLLKDTGITEIDGMLLDLGISSHQIDVAERGFSYMAEGGLDMRMDRRSGLTADEIVNRWSPAELRRVLHDYGEEPRAGRIARAIVAARPIASTAELARLVRGQVRQQDEVKTLSRVFQGLRIAVNGELERLEQALAAGLHLIRPGGRMAVISYHSLEDRRVKRFFRYGNLEGEPVHDFYGNLLTPWREVARKPVEPGEEEKRVNPRSRSARLRIAERLDFEQ